MTSEWAKSLLTVRIRRATMWHEALGEASKQVSVTSGKASEVDFSIGE
jgi:hypothetical protein